MSGYIGPWWGYQGDGYCPPIPYPLVVPTQAAQFQGIDLSLALVTPGDTGTSTPLPTAIGNRVQRGGDQMLGRLLLVGDPVSNLEPATKQYADRLVPLAGGTMTGPLLLAADPTQSLQAATKEYVDTAALKASAGIAPASPFVLNEPLTLNEALTLNAAVTTSSPITATQTFSGVSPGATQLLWLQMFDNTQGGTSSGLNLAIRLDVQSLGSPANAWNTLNADMIEAGGVNTGTSPLTHSGIYSRVQKLSAPIGRTTVATAVAAGGSTTVAVADVTNFSWTYPGESAKAVSPTNPLPVKVGSTVYQCIGVSSTTGTVYPPGYQGVVSETGVPAFGPSNPLLTDGYSLGGYVAGGLAGAGVLTFSTAVSQADGALGNAVVAQVQGDALEAATFELRDCTGLPSSLSGQLLPVEIDLSASGPDDVASRRLLGLFFGFAGGTGNPYTSAGFDTGIFMLPSTNNVSINSFVRALGTINQTCLDMAAVTLGAGAVAAAFPGSGAIAWQTDQPNFPDRVINASIAPASVTVGANTFWWLQAFGADIGTGTVGLGIASRAPLVISSAFTLATTQVGQLIQTLSAAFTVTLAPAATIPEGAGFVVSNVTGQYVTTVAPDTGDAIADLSGGKINLLPGQAVLILSDQSHTYYAFRFNGYAAGATAPVSLAQLNAMAGFTSDDVGAVAYCSNARNTGEAAGAGTGCPVYIKSVASGVANWCVVGTGVTATA